MGERIRGKREKVLGTTSFSEGCVRERERKRKSECVCVCERDREGECVCECVIEKKKNV